MGNRPFGERNVRSLTRSPGGSYSLTIPLEYIQKLKWRAKQKLSVELTDDGLLIKDWKS